MDATTILLLAGVVFIGLLLLAVAFYLCALAFSGALLLFGWAGEQGFVGVAAYIACWVFLLPVMLIASILVGFLASS